MCACALVCFCLRVFACVSVCVFVCKGGGVVKATIQAVPINHNCMTISELSNVCTSEHARVTESGSFTTVKIAYYGLWLMEVDGDLDNYVNTWACPTSL